MKKRIPILKHNLMRAAMTLALIVTCATAWAQDLTINSADDWNTFVTNVNSGTSYSGQTVTLAADINVSTMAGSTQTNSFKGTLYGGGHTLTFNATATADNCAPFGYIDGATIKCLNVDGTISTGYKYAAGIAAHSYGSCTIKNCRSSIAVTTSISDDGTHAGFVAVHENGTLTLTNCLFDGSITGNSTTNCGGFVGWRSGTTLKFNNCLMAGTMAISQTDGSALFNRNGGSTLSNCYYDGNKSYGSIATQGATSTTATGSDLQALLGSGWEVSGDEVVPVMDPYNLAIASLGGITNFYPYTGDEIDIVYTVTAADGTALTKGTHYTETLSPLPVLEKGEYTLTISGIGNYIGSYTFSFFVGDGILVTSSTTTMTTGTYAVAGEVTIDSRITVSGNVHLMLYDGCTMNATKGIQVSSGNSLTIDAQSTGSNMGKLIATTNTYYYAGIGGSTDPSEGGTITINGGEITASGGNYGAGIGGGREGAGGIITINGGKVTASGGNYGAGIGGSLSGGGGNITINGGKVTASGGNWGAGIGAGSDGSAGTITINGGTVIANGGQRANGIGNGTNGSGGTIQLSNTNDEDSIYASSYGAATMSIAPGKAFTDGTNIYTSNTPSSTLMGIAGKTLTPANFSQSGDEYTIYTATGWGLFCDALEGGQSFSGKTVYLANDIEVSRIAGSGAGDNLAASDRPFCGTFDGQGNTLTFNYGSSSDPANENNLAPFRYVNDATIQHLHVSGDIYTQQKHTGGIVGQAYGTTNITDCHSSVNIISSIDGDGTHGGIMSCSWKNSTTNIEGCLFDGSIQSADGYTTDQCGGFVGWKNATINVTNSLLTATFTNIDTGTGDYPSATFVRNGDPSTITNCYYVTALGTEQGKQRHSITAGANVTVAHSGTATAYATSGITAYKNGNTQLPGLLYNNNNNDVLYAGDGDAVSLTLTNNLGEAPTGYQPNYTANNGGTITNSGTSYTLTMPNNDVTISASFSAIPWSGSGTSTEPYIIMYPSQLDLLAYRVNGTHGYTAEADGFSGKYFKLNNDIEYSYTSDWNETSSNESNYEAIGYYGGSSEDRPFKGDFDGNNKTVGGIRIYKSGTSYTDQYQGLFGQTEGANIHDLTLADARITGYKNSGGIVGSNHGTVTRCQVEANVAIHAVQNVASALGGIAGRNYYGCTISHCTSAATISIAADADWYYGGIVGVNGQGTLSDNFVVGATIPAASNNGHGAICGYNNSGTLTRNYYNACTVAEVENATGVGCGYISDGNGGYAPSDITTNDGAIPVFTLTLDDNLTSNTVATVSYNETNYFKNGITVTVDANNVTIPEGYTFSGITVTPNTGDAPAVTDNHDGTYSFTMPAADVTVSATLIAPEPVTYLDENGDEQTKQPSEYTILTGSETELTGGWYVVNSDISYTGTVTLSGNVNLILADGKTMNVGTSDNRISDGDGIICYDEANDTYNDLTIYGQSLGTGKLSIYVSGNYYHAIAPHNITVNGGNVITHTDGNNSCGIDTKRSGDITINGGNVSAITTDTYIFAWAISAAGNITINGGTVNAESNGQAIHADGNIDINSGNVTATTTSADLASIYSSHTITLGWTNATDRIYASSYRGTVNIASGQVFVTDDATPVVVSGTISNLNLINGKTLSPAVAVTLNDGITAGNGIYSSGENLYAQVGQTVTVNANSVTVPEGYTLSGITVTPTAEVTAGDNNTYSFTVPAEDVTVSPIIIGADWNGSGTENDPYMIYNENHLNLLAYRVNGTHGETLQSDGYEGKYFKLGADITYPHTTDWNDASSTENNYEAIGGYYDNTTRYFKGHFDGNNKTVSGIRIYKDGTDNHTDSYQGLFGRTNNANIHDLTLADTRITGYQNIGGIVGSCLNDANTLSNCHATTTVAIHAVQEDANYHGGIAGYNYGTIDHCTSAATLTAANRACSYHGGIAGYNYTGTLRDNLAIGATVPYLNDAWQKRYGAICGYNDSRYGILERNYYYNCTVAGVQNATNVGCFNADVTANDGAVPGNARTVAGYGTNEKVGWTFIASPLTENTDPDSEAVVDIFSASEYDLYRLSPSDTMWQNYKQTGDHYHFNLENGRGYLYATQQQETVKFIGENNAFNMDDIKNVTLPKGFNLVGNPFPRAAYINKPYYTLNDDGSAVVTETSTGYISPCTGVVVQVENGSETVTFRTTPFPEQGTNNNGNLNIALTQTVTTRGGSSTTTLDNAIVSFNEGSQLGKFYFGTQNANIYLPQGAEEYAIAYSDGYGEMPVNFRANENGQYTITVNPENVEMIYLHLIDNLTGADVDLLNGGDCGSSPATTAGGRSYTFTAKTTDYESRFRLVFVCGDANDDHDGDNETFAFYFNGTWIIANEGQATLQVIDLNGRILSSETVNGSVSKSIHAAPGVYMIRLINGENVKVQKVVIE